MTQTILVVDGSVSVRLMLAFTLKNAGYQVVEAVNGQDGFLKSTLQKFDLVLTEINLPHMGGFELIRELRKSETYKGSPILILSTESSEKMKQEGRLAGATGFLVKPFDPNRLVEVIRKVISF